MSSSPVWVDAILKHRFPIEPIETGIAPVLTSLTGVKSVVFDIYGTLLVSGSGDVGAADTSVEIDRVAEAVEAVGLMVDPTAIPTVGEFRQHIEAMNEERRSDQCPKPEVDIVEVWRRTLESRGVTAAHRDVAHLVQLAAEYEARSNPSWPMPGAVELLTCMKAAGLPLGIVSNAQVFTIPLVEDLLPKSSLGEPGLAGGCFHLDLCVFSNRFRQAKPGPRLFDVLCDGLGRCGIQPDEALFVGNDMLNDVWAASQAGIRTAWFAGDARSCRPREDDSRCRSLRPNVVLTELMQLPTCLGLE